MKKLTSDTVTAFLNAPYALWSQLNSSSLLGNRNAQDLIRELDALLERAAMLRGYLDTRQNSQGSDLGHDKAVKAANRLKTKVRHALGYTIPRQDVSF